MCLGSHETTWLDVSWRTEIQLLENIRTWRNSSRLLESIFPSSHDSTMIPFSPSPTLFSFSLYFWGPKVLNSLVLWKWVSVIKLVYERQWINVLVILLCWRCVSYLLWIYSRREKKNKNLKICQISFRSTLRISFKSLNTTHRPPDSVTVPRQPTFVITVTAVVQSNRHKRGRLRFPKIQSTVTISLCKKLSLNFVSTTTI